MTLLVPAVVVLSAAAVVPGTAARGSWAALPATGALVQEAGTYRVRAGDTLWGIAADQLGDPYRWTEIAATSASIMQPGGVRLVDPDLIRPGWTLALPSASPGRGRALLSGAIAIDAGSRNSCALIEGGQVACWGYSAGSVAVLVSEEVGETGATAVSSGFDHSCAVFDGGRVACWGSNEYGQLGVATSADRSSAPVLVTGLTGATAVSAGFDQSCAVIDDGQVTCWGNNEYGQLGVDATADWSSTPVLVPGVTGATAVSAGEGSSCALIEQGQVTCWGDVYDSGDFEPASSSPVLVPGVTGAIAVSAGVESSCALLGGGQVTCWDQVGGTPVTVPGLAGATAIAAGTNQVCALIGGGQVTCWGEDEYGELGGVDPLDPADVGDGWSSTLVLVSGVTGATAVTAGQNHSCAVIQGGQVTCWGYGSPTPLMVAADPRPS